MACNRRSVGSRNLDIDISVVADNALYVKCVGKHNYRLNYIMITELYLLKEVIYSDE